MSSAIEELHQLKQSLWYDNIQRRLLENGEMAGMISRGEIRGVTSNPSIFHNAIAKTHDYDPALKPMAWSGWTPEQIFYQLAVEDIRAAADLFSPLYQETHGGDGYVSLEVSPYLANDTEGTIREAQKLWDWVNRPNLMIKIPATKAGLEAIRRTIAAGINVNVTLIFSLARYAEVMEAYLSGLEDRVAAGKPVDGIASVASFFVSRVDTKIDPKLDAIVKSGGANAKAASALPGKAAIANACLAYALFKKTFETGRFARLKAAGARTQRPLWASTSTKNPAYRDVIYVEELIGADTVNTVPPQTLTAFGEHGRASLTLEKGAGQAQKDIEALEDLGISMEKVTDELEAEGVKAFADAFTALLKTIDERCKAAQKELGDLKAALPAQVQKLEQGKTAQRIFAADASLWTQDAKIQEETRRRLGWLKAPQNGLALLPELDQFLAECQASGFSKVLLLGMGGSSLAPEVLASTFGVRERNGALGMELTILDSTDPGQVKIAARKSPVDRTLFVVSSKSGSTSEVKAFLDYFWKKATARLGKKAGSHFIAITDPGTSLEKVALEKGFRKVFRADSQVGGRYSALTAFGLVPASLLGLDVERLLSRAQDMANQCGPEIPAGRNPGLVLGAILGAAALKGRDKLTIIADSELESFGSWLEQLIAESSGKNGRGIVPVDLEPLASPKEYGQDRIFAYLRMGGSEANKVERLKKAGLPVMEFLFKDEFDLGAEFYRWEMATAVACVVLDVSAFDQPDVQDNKTRTSQKIAAFQSSGKLAEEAPIWSADGVKVFGKPFDGLAQAKTISEVVDAFLKCTKPGDYVALNAYLPREPRTFRKLQQVRKAIFKKTHYATTLGFGPRFLHSTGQLHKGGPDSGVFIQITAEPVGDLDVPGECMTFGTLERAQALGDLEALLARKRRAIRIHLDGAKIEDLM